MTTVHHTTNSTEAELDDVIKNPARLQSPSFDPDYHLPHYIRNGISPIDGGFSSLDGAIIPEDSPPAENEADISLPEIGQYILMFQGKIVSCGAHDEILEKVQEFIYNNEPTVMQELVVLKRVEIKVGVFLEPR